MENQEMILDLGLEAGRSTVYRTPKTSADWLFHVESNSVSLDEDLNEDWKHWRSDSFQSVQEALASIAEDGSWVFFFPVSIHPEFRKLVWELAQQTAATFPEERSHWLKTRKLYWETLCQQGSQSASCASAEDGTAPPLHQEKLG